MLDAPLAFSFTVHQYRERMLRLSQEINLASGRFARGTE